MSSFIFKALILCQYKLTAMSKRCMHNSNKIHCFFGLPLLFQHRSICVTVIHTDTISVICRSQNNESCLRWTMWHLLIVTVTQTHFDLSVQIQVTYRSHVTGSNFAQHTHVVPMGIRKLNCRIQKKRQHFGVQTDYKTLGISHAGKKD